MEQPSHSSMIMLPTVKPRYRNRPQDWEPHKSEIEDLYHQKTLEYIMRHMEQRHSFRATMKQWKSQLKKWGFKKRTERDEYRAILKLKRQREDQQSNRASEFSLRGKVVPPAKIARYEAEALKNGLIAEDDTFSQVATPPDLLCWTPKLEGAVSLSPDGIRYPRPGSRGTLQFQHYGRGPSGRASLLSPFHRSPSMRYSPSFTRNSEDTVQDSMQLVPASPLRTPPLQPFDWWWDFVDFNIPQSPAILKGPSSNPFVRLLAPLGQKINNNEDEHIFRDLVIKSRQEIRCAGCRLNSIISSLVRKYLAGDARNPKLFERFVGAAIQKLNEWMELSEYQFGAPSTLVGAALLQLGRNTEALPLLIEGLKDAEPDITHNDLAQYRLKVALCHLELSQIEDAVEQLRLAFGPEFGRLAILAPNSDCCTKHTTRFNIISKPMEYEKSYDGVFLEASELDQIADVEIPAGTFCLEHEIIPISAIDETSTLYSTVFFSNVTLRRMDLALLKTAGVLVRKLHLHNATTSVGFNIDMTGPEVVI